MPILKRLIKINESKAIVIPYSYFEYYRSKGKEINEVSLEIDKKIIIEPIFKDIAAEPKQKDVLGIETRIDSLFKED
jgi:hypothetical protein